MKGLGKIAVCIAGGLALNAGLHAANPPASPALVAVKAPAGNNPPSDNPYTTIAVRNIFGLNPPPPPGPVDPPDKNLPKITPTGIMGVFGQSQVLFKVAPVAKGGPPPKDEFYILSEGQREDDIEVVKIDERRSLVTFDNHGITQELPLAEAAASGGGAAGAWSGGGGGMNPGMAAGASGGSPGSFTQFGGGSGRNSGGAPNGNPGFNRSGLGGPGGANGAVNGMDFNTPVQGHVYQPEASGMSADEAQQVLTINHVKAILDNSIAAPVFPPSKYDREAGITPPDPGSGQNDGPSTR